MDDLDLGATITGFRAGQKVFNRYTLTRMLGRGGMGVVWLARDDKLERDVALKFLPEVMMGDKLALSDLKRETRRSLELTHSHIVRIYDFVEDARTAAIAMEYIAGETLTNARVDRPGHCFDPSDLRDWVGQLCSALEYAHSKAQVVHRDLKPANLMIDGRGDLKVTDFGISSSIADSVSRVSVQAGSSGTPVYMSPQQMLGEKPAVTDDVYALGATLYDLLTGKPPFHSGNIILQVQNKVPPSLAARRAELGVTGEAIPLAWEETIAACLAKEAAERPQSAGEVWRRLNGGDAVESPKLKVEDRAKAPVEPSMRSKSIRRAPLFTGLAVALVVLAAAGWYFGLHVPEQQRLTEIARLEAAGREMEAAKLRNAQERTAAEAARLALARGGIVVRTNPSGAEVRVGAIALDKSPLTLKEQKLGKYPVRVRLEGHEDWDGEVEVKENEFTDLNVPLVRSTGTLSLASEPVGLEAEVVGRVIPNAPPLGLRQTIRTPREVKLPTGTYEITFRRSGWPEQTKTIQVERNGSASAAADFSPGKLVITSTPTGAEVFSVGRDGPPGRPLGVTPLTLPEVIPGRQSVELRLKGYTAQTVSGTVKAREELRLNAALEKQLYPQPGQAWENTLGQKFVPVPGTGVLFCVWETRVQDFEAFVKETGYDATSGMYSLRKGSWGQHGDSWKSPGFKQGPPHPVVGMSEADAKTFCVWLTKKERAEGRLSSDQEYRLPTDAEWDAAVGKDEFPWGNQWPPPRGAGNYAGSEARDGDWPSNWSTIDGYSDGYARTAPVGSFAANRYGIYDLGGNVWERVGDRSSGLRGASFSNGVRGHLASSGRGTLVNRSKFSGFRVVCVVGSVR